jgi:AmmeMemoRadiSam system protein A
MSPLCSELRHELLARARRAIREAASGEPAARSESKRDFHDEAERGVFVTLHRRGQLRGCVGQIEACGPLGEVVERCAIAAAEEDPRFAPVKPGEVAELEIEISLLSPLEPIAPAAIEVGRHGLVVERGMQRGLLLPQVATERHWQWQRFLEETCVKAGLERDAWRSPATRTFAFTTEVFSEADDA